MFNILVCTPFRCLMMVSRPRQTSWIGVGLPVRYPWSTLRGLWVCDLLVVVSYIFPFQRVLLSHPERSTTDRIVVPMIDNKRLRVDLQYSVIEIGVVVRAHDEDVLLDIWTVMWTTERAQVVTFGIARLGASSSTTTAYLAGILVYLLQFRDKSGVPNDPGRVALRPRRLLYIWDRVF